jgi:hypothetical protein
MKVELTSGLLVLSNMLNVMRKLDLAIMTYVAPASMGDDWYAYVLGTKRQARKFNVLDKRWMR